MEETAIFRQEATVSRSAADIYRILILEKLEKALYMWTAYNNSRANTGERTNTNRRCKSEILTLYMVLRPRMATRNAWDHEALEEHIEKERYREALIIITEYMEKDLKLTNIATQEQYDRTDVIAANKRQGYI